MPQPLSNFNRQCSFPLIPSIVKKPPIRSLIIFTLKVFVLKKIFFLVKKKVSSTEQYFKYTFYA